MKLTELKPWLHRYVESNEGHPGIKPAGGEFGDPYPHVTLPRADSVEDAQGMMFLCPACFTKNGGPKGTHRIMVTFVDRGVPDNYGSHARDGSPSRWVVTGTGFHNLTLSPSVDVGCWHGFVQNGDVLTV